MKTITELGMALNRQVAELLGWTEIFAMKGALLGRPPGGSPHSRDQGMVPNWTGNFEDCCQLGLEYRITPHQSSIEAFVFDMEKEHGVKLDFKTAYRHLMVLRVFHLLHDRASTPIAA